MVEENCPKCNNDMELEDCEFGVFWICEVCGFEKEHVISEILEVENDRV